MPKEPEIIRKSLGLKAEVRPALEASYHSDLIDQIKQNQYRLEAGRLTIRLAEEFGFCYGVDRAIDYAYEARAKFPDRRIFLTNEIIHNPQVNQKLKDMGILLLTEGPAGEIPLDDIQKEDVVLIPAFGTSTQQLAALQAKGCILVDTTCGSVMSVWKRVEAYSRDGFTSIIHGKYDHEETIATSSRALINPLGKYLIVRDQEQAAVVCRYIEEGGDREAFNRDFAKAVSPGFNPETDLAEIGCANQTTMLSTESIEIAEMLKTALKKRYGAEELPRRFRHFDTICSATQDRQDAMIKLTREALDLMIVVGGFNSSNTGHLAEIALKTCPAYHVENAGCLISREWIEHKKVLSPEIIRTENWLPDGPLRVGVTAGASTPNRVIEEVIARLLELGERAAALS